MSRGKKITCYLCKATHLLLDTKQSGMCELGFKIQRKEEKNIGLYDIIPVENCPKPRTHIHLKRWREFFFP